MPLGRKIYDGDISGRDIGLAEWGSTFDNKSKTNKYASAKRTKKTSLRVTGDKNIIKGEAEKDRYLITYADVITLLLGLFIILYAVSNIDKEKYDKMKYAFENSFGSKTEIANISAGAPDAIITPIDRLRDHLSQVIKENNYNDFIKLEENERGITIHILDEILFLSGKAELNRDPKVFLSKIASILNDIPNDIRIEGHTDNIPINTPGFPSNWHLSVSRALNTAYYLIDRENLDAERVSIVGYSEYKPIASNRTASGRALNRRVDIVIIRE